MWEWLGRLMRRGTEEEPDEFGEPEPASLTWEQRLEKLEERVRTLDERTRKQRYREQGADVAPRQGPNVVLAQGEKAELMRRFRASRERQA